MTLKIHAFPLSPRGFKALWAVHHVGAGYEFRLVDLMKGDQLRPDYVVLNPNKKMPTLEDGGFALWESNAIVEYLASKHPDAGLAPADAQMRASALQWMFWESTTWDPACAILAFERVVKGMFGRGAPDPIEVEKGLQKFNVAAGVLNGHLKGRSFMCGDRLSMADISIGAALTLTEPAQLPLEDYPEIRRWGASLEALPSWRKTRAMQAAPAAA
ncbi:MAG: glutathione S-transferase family protein [Hyphomonadaceae bacterium]